MICLFTCITIMIGTVLTGVSDSLVLINGVGIGDNKIDVMF